MKEKEEKEKMKGKRKNNMTTATWAKTLYRKVSH